jgi:hypothetical protein
MKLAILCVSIAIGIGVMAAAHVFLPTLQKYPYVLFGGYGTAAVCWAVFGRDSSQEGRDSSDAGHWTIAGVFLAIAIIWGLVAGVRLVVAWWSDVGASGVLTFLVVVGIGTGMVVAIAMAFASVGKLFRKRSRRKSYDGSSYSVDENTQQEPPSFLSGRGGDFAGGGASGSYDGLDSTGNSGSDRD